MATAMARFFAFLLLDSLLGATLAEFTPNIFFNWTIQPHDALLTLSPDAGYELDPTNETFTRAWNLSFEDSPWSAYQQGQVGLGASHLTAATIMTNPRNRQDPILQLTGTAFSNLYLAGQAVPFEGYKLNVVATVDSVESNLAVLADTPGWIAEASVAYGSHLGAFGIFNGTWRVDALVATMGIQTLAPSWGQVPNTTERFAITPQGSAYLSLNDMFQYRGQWLLTESIGGVGEQGPTKDYDHISGQLGASVAINVPPHTAMLVLKGLVGPNSPKLLVDYNPNPPVRFSPIILTVGPWVAESTLMVTTLDPAVNYTLDITHADSAMGTNRTAGLRSITFYSGLDGTGSANGTEPGPSPVHKKSSNAAAIGGGVGGGVGGLLLIGLIAFCCWKRRKAKTTDRESDGSQFEIDDTIGVQPYASPSPVTFTTSNLNNQPKTKTGYDDGDLVSPQSSPQSPQMMEHKRALLQHMSPPPVSPSAGASSVSSYSATTPYMLPDAHTPPPPHRPAFTQEEDAGGIPEESEPERIPPSYNPQWRRSIDAAASSSGAVNYAGVDTVASAALHSSPGIHGRPLPPRPGHR